MTLLFQKKVHFQYYTSLHFGLCMFALWHPYLKTIESLPLSLSLSQFYFYLLCLFPYFYRHKQRTAAMSGALYNCVHHSRIAISMWFLWKMCRKYQNFILDHRGIETKIFRRYIFQGPLRTWYLGNTFEGPFKIFMNIFFNNNRIHDFFFYIIFF